MTLNEKLKEIVARAEKAEMVVVKRTKWDSYQFIGPSPTALKDAEAIAPEGGNLEQLELVPAQDLRFLLSLVKEYRGALEMVDAVGMPEPYDRIIREALRRGEEMG